MPELATAWVTLAVSTRGMQRDIRRAMQEAERSSRFSPRVDTARASSAGREFGDRFSSAAKTALAAGGLALGVAGLADQFKKVMSVGMDWTTNMNTLQAVTGATVDQLKAAGDAARKLGNDITLPATSANDAAAAMTELAKGGFTVQQSMDAAKGSLQLAAAAQISAAEAATIQSQALQAFGLNAADAGKISDTLANAANASSAEITDVAAALQQAGTVANQFGLSAQDTAAAIALLANNGIKGSDAGTLLKSALLALTDQGNPAQGAIKELGLTVYDAQGKFVGLHELFKQLGDASAHMTAEQYQAATAVLFGSDAMRLAGVASKDGAKSYDAMRVSIERQGAAADVAAAKTKGLPGAWERVNNAVESLRLKAYDTLEGTVTKALDRVSGGLGKVQDSWSSLAGNSVAGAFARDVKSVFASLVSTATAAWPAILKIGTSLATASAAIGVGSWKALVFALQAAAGMVQAITPALQVLGGLMQSHQGLVAAAALAWLAFKTVPGILGRVTTGIAPLSSALATAGGGVRTFGTTVRDLGSAYRNSVQWIRQANPTVSGAGAAFRVLAANAGAAATGGLSLVSRAAGGVVSALGGPLSAALIAAGIAFAVISQENQQAAQSLKAYQDAVARTGVAQTTLNEALLKSRGAFDDTVRSTAVDRIRAIGEELQAASERTGSFLDRFRSADTGSIWDHFWSGFGPFGRDDGEINMDHRIENEAAAARSAKAALDGLKMTQESLTDVVYGGQASFDILVSQLDHAGDSGRKVADEMREARTEFVKQQEVARRVAPGIHQMADAMRVFADNTATAADKSKALNAALDALNPDRTAADAQAAHTEALQRVAEAGATPADAGGGVGAALFKPGGAVDTTKTNGAELYRTLRSIVDATADVAASGGDMAAAMSGDQEQFAALAKRYQTDIAQIKAAADSLGYTDAVLVIKAAGEPEARQAIARVAEAFESAPTAKSLEFNTTDVDSAEQVLKSYGIEFSKVDNLNGVTKITINDDAARAKLQQVKDQILNLPDEKSVAIRVKAALEGDFNDPAVKQAQRQLLADAFGQRANGAIVAMAGGGLRSIAKPQSADIYAGRGAGTIFAEQETGGEAYIPLAPAKRSRSTRILSEVARLFGMTVMEDGGITVDELKQFASSISGGVYALGAGNGDALDGTDCSGAQSTIANFITGGTGRFATAGEAQALLARGFKTGDPPAGIAAYWVGWRNGGPGGGHTAGTIVDPDGGNVNVEMGGRSGGGQYGGSAAGASDFPNRAWIALAGGDDPSKNNFGGGGYRSATSKELTAAANKTSSAATTKKNADQAVDDATYRRDKAQQRVDDLKAAGKDTKDAQHSLDVANRELGDAKERQTKAADKLTKAQEDEADLKANGKQTEGSGSGGDASSFGQSLVSGMLQAIGLDGSVFSNPFDWPNVKSLMAGLNWGGGMIKSLLGGGGEGRSTTTTPSDTFSNLGGGASAMPGFNLPGVSDFLKPIGPQAITPRAEGSGIGTGAAQNPAGPSFVINGNVGMDPRSVTQRFDAAHNQAYRRNMPAVRPR